MKINPERLNHLTPERRRSIMERSMEDIASVFEDVCKIVTDIKASGNAVALDTIGNIRRILPMRILRSPKRSRMPTADQPGRSGMPEKGGKEHP